MIEKDTPFFERPNVDDLLPGILREAREDREEIKALSALVIAADAMLAKGYGVAGGVLCIPPCPEQSAFVDAMARWRSAKK